MNLNLDILADYLPKKYLPRRYGPQDRHLRYAMAIPYETGCTMMPDILYIATAASLPKTPPAGVAVICISGNVPQRWLASGNPVLHLSGNAGVYDVYHDVYNVYTRFSRWDHDLRKTLDNTQEFSFEKLLLLCTEMLNKTIVISDQVLRNVFHTVISHDTNGQFLYTVETPNRIIDARTLGQIRDISRLERHIRTPYLSMTSDTNQDFYCYNLYPRGHYLGCISIGAGSRPFQESDFALADYIFTYLTKGYLQHIYNFGSPVTQEIVILKKLLNHHPLTEEEQKVLSLQEGEVFICMKLKEMPGNRSLIKEYMCTSIGASVPCELYSMIYHEEIICLIRFQKSQHTPEYWQEETHSFANYLECMGYSCGISDQFCDYRNLEEYLQQASYAVEQGSRTDSTLHFFTTYRMQYILHECSVHISPQTLYSSQLQKLIERDRQKGSDYLHTLNIYLQSECNASKAAEILFIHRSSLMKRLDKIQKILEMDLDDPDTRLYLRICLRLINLAK